jgi:twitching motility protein PilT
MTNPLHTWLAQTLALSGSDLHLSAGLAPMVRVHGALQTLPTPPVCAHQLEALLHAALPDWRVAAHRQDSPAAGASTSPNLQDHDTAIDWPGLGRFRVNVFAQARGWSSVWRVIPQQVPSLEAIGAPACLTEWARQPHGLLLVTGATGSGKSTTLAALVHHLNTTQALHILTLEDPIEFVHTSQRSLVQQRSVPGHSAGFDTALRAALRQDPDVVLVGEMRDLPTVRLALSAAETGHMVLGSLHTRSATQAVERLVDVFPSSDKALVRQQLSLSLLGVVTQTLCRRADGAGRVAAHELLYATPAVRNLIRESKTAQLPTVQQTGAQFGMQTLAQSLAGLVAQGRITPEEALHHAPALAT